MGTKLIINLVKMESDPQVDVTGKECVLTALHEQPQQTSGEGIEVSFKVKTA